MLQQLIWKLEGRWPRFWMRLAGLPFCRRIATGLALWWAPPYFQRHCLADLNPRGFISTKAKLFGSRISLGANVFLDDRVLISQEWDAGAVSMGNRVRLQEDTHILVGPGGSVMIGDDTHLQRGCQLNAYKEAIRIGNRVEIAARCAFYSYDHGVDGGKPIVDQPLTSRGEISIGDEAWLGHGVIVLSGVRIGKGAVIGAGSVVTNDIPDESVAAGVPARVIKMRDGTGITSISTHRR